MKGMPGMLWGLSLHSAGSWLDFIKETSPLVLCNHSPDWGPTKNMWAKWVSHDQLTMGWCRVMQSGRTGSFNFNSFSSRRQQLCRGMLDFNQELMLKPPEVVYSPSCKRTSNEVHIRGAIPGNWWKIVQGDCLEAQRFFPHSQFHAEFMRMKTWEQTIKWERQTYSIIIYHSIYSLLSWQNSWLMFQSSQDHSSQRGMPHASRRSWKLKATVAWRIATVNCSTLAWLKQPGCIFTP